MLPLATTTKVGPGEKTKAYVVRQNTCLKILLFAFVGLVIILIVLMSTLYDVHVERRSKAHDAGHHRREEHALRMQVGRLGMRLQEHMKDEVRDMGILREYRARMYRAIGEYQNNVRAAVDTNIGANATMHSTLTRLELELDEHLEVAMRQLWADVNEEGKHASERLHNLTAELVRSMSTDAGEAKEFEELYGEGTDFHEDAEQGLKGDDDLGEDGAEDDWMDSDAEEMKMRYALERLHARLVAMPNISLPQAELTEWEDAYNNALDVLGDDSKEADLQQLQKRLAAKLESKGVTAAMGGADGQEDEYAPSVMDQFESALEAAKVMPHKADLFNKYAEWQAGNMPTTDLVQHIEELYEQRVLETGLFDDWDD